MTHTEMVEKIALKMDDGDYGVPANKIDQVLAAASRAGYVLVPLEATNHMIQEGSDVEGINHLDQVEAEFIAMRVYRVCIAARPGQEKEDV